MYKLYLMIIVILIVIYSNVLFKDFNFENL